jgi:hypothetical protein
LQENSTKASTHVDIALACLAGPAMMALGKKTSIVHQK